MLFTVLFIVYKLATTNVELSLIFAELNYNFYIKNFLKMKLKSYIYY